MKFKLQPLNTKFMISVPTKLAKKIIRTMIEKEVVGKCIEQANPSTGELELAVSVEDKFYPLHPNHKDVYGKRYVYHKEAKGEWIQYDRFSKADRRSMPTGYFCTRPGHILLGSVVRESDVEYFMINKDVSTED